MFQEQIGERRFLLSFLTEAICVRDPVSISARAIISLGLQKSLSFLRLSSLPRGSAGKALLSDDLSKSSVEMLAAYIHFRVTT